MTQPVTQFSGNNGSIHLEPEAVTVSNIVGGKKRFAYQEIQSIGLKDPTWLTQGALTVVTRAQAFTHAVGSQRMQNRAAGNAALWRVNVTKGAMPQAAALKAELDRRLRIVRGQAQA